MMEKKQTVFILIGPPGAGKGTQAQSLARNYSLYHIDTGHSLRSEIVSASQLGMRAKEYMNRGELVPFELVIEVIKAAMLRIPADKRGYLFDGFPRNRQQAEGLEKILKELGRMVDAVIYLETSHDILMDRLAYRVTCSQCDAKYNLKLNLPKHEGICDLCGGKLITRQDDRPEVIENRLKAYEFETAPLISYYEELGVLKRVNANQTSEEVFLNIQERVFKNCSEQNNIAVKS